MQWKIWYGDGTSFSSEDGEPWEAPAWNVQVIVQVNEDSGRYNQCMDNYYIWKDRWLGVDFTGLLDYLAHNGAGCVVRFGRTIPNALFQSILRKAESDPDFPQRSAWHKDEVRP